MDNIRDVVDTIATVGGFIGSIQAIAAAVKWFASIADDKATAAFDRRRV